MAFVPSAGSFGSTFVQHGGSSRSTSCRRTLGADGHRSQASKTGNVGVKMMAKKAAEYDMKTRLREELEAPFRKVRMAIYAASGVSATIGGFVSGSRILASMSGISGVQPLGETIPNLAIDLGVVAGAVFLYQREVKAGERRLERLARGAMVGSLSIELSNRKVIKVSDLRGSRRVLIVGGNSEKVKEILKAGKPFQKRLEERNLVVVPVAFDKISDFKELSGGWSGQSVAEAVLTNEWKLWAEEESKRVRAPDIQKDIFMTIIRKDGRVGARSSQGLAWQRLLDDFEKLPKKDKYGTP
ncbi:hypothetical protein NDN08_004181 [Rhodosorus marinus]|uniref:Uncharacterized protein n=1 Tax=Rhodosorus marinus TaxID=101924 RepID=A0AAV8UHI2_9RHOD|nr:hypothetical protein NDN08_004181 [Rhodosorus marinus]